MPLRRRGVASHSLLTDLDKDDHPHYLNVARHDLTDRHPLATVVPLDLVAYSWYLSGIVAAPTTAEWIGPTITFERDRKALVIFWYTLYQDAATSGYIETALRVDGGAALTGTNTFTHVPAGEEGMVITQAIVDLTAGDHTIEGMIHSEAGGGLADRGMLIIWLS